jgi:hypothetical protein
MMVRRISSLIININNVRKVNLSRTRNLFQLSIAKFQSTIQNGEVLDIKYLLKTLKDAKFPNDTKLVSLILF